jgi:acyl-CoA thioester hydrolase
MEAAQVHLHPVRVYYEDTDLAGVVYYANYLKFFERGRTEALRAAGFDQGRLKETLGLVFLVTRITVEYHAPAQFDDVLSIETRTERVGGASLSMAQRASREGRVLVEAAVRVAAVGADGRPMRIPEELRAAIGAPSAPAPRSGA